MQQTCATCGSAFTIHPDEEAFLGKIGWDFGQGSVRPPLPRHCPECRSSLRVAHRNERYMYRNKSAMSGKDVVSIFAPEPVHGAPYKIYTQEEWRSDAWDPLSYGRDFDFGKPFLPQWESLHRAVPRVAVTTIANENCDYTSGTGYCRNCYLINSSEHCEDCYYGKLFQKSKSCMDCSYIYDSELCHDCFSVSKCYGCKGLAFSQNCNGCLYSSNLRGCSNCCLCTNLERKEYHFQNQPLSREEYEKRVAAFLGSARKTAMVKAQRDEMMRTMVRKYANIVNADGCTGDYIENSDRCLDCYDVFGSQDCRYVRVGVDAKDLYDCSNMYVRPELCYQILGSVESTNCAYCIYVFHSQNVLYSEYCYNCSDCFGCSSLTRKRFCVFNKQYTEAEYKSLVAKIVEHMRKTGEWGEFFPASLSPFGYNESVAQEYQPKSKEQALAAGFHWRDMTPKEKATTTDAPPDAIVDAEDDVVKHVYSCATCQKPYRIIPQELAFCRGNTVPLPRECPDCRYDARLKLRNPRRLWERPCMRCQKPVQSTYAPGRPETVYCESCYRETVY